MSQRQRHDRNHYLETEQNHHLLVVALQPIDLSRAIRSLQQQEAVQTLFEVELEECYIDACVTGEEHLRNLGLQKLT